MMPGTNFPSSPVPRSMLVGREREHVELRKQLDCAQSGDGSLVLVSGEAGIGKTALVRALADDAAASGCLVLIGACYDLGTPPAYGLWREVLRGAAGHDDLRSMISLLQDREWLSTATTPDAFFSDLQQILEAFANRSALLLVLEDLHWSDTESLEFLRVFARHISEMPILLIATYRDDELAPSSTFYQLLPHLVREANPERITLHRLDESAIETLVVRRYGLPGPDLARLSKYLETRSQGVPLYLIELLRTLEEEQCLRHTQDGWVLGDIESHYIPALIKQLIDGRISRFSPENRRLLELAAVIGQEVPVLLWRHASEASDDLLSETIELAARAHVLEETSSSLHLQFTHALVRDALYESLPRPRRQRWHRRIGETLAGEPSSEPDIIAHHFRQALDSRAIEWLVRAGSQAEHAAWITASRHFELAIEMMTGDDADPAEEGCLLVRRARLLRMAEPQTALAILKAAEARAIEVHDTLLLAYVTFFRGQIRCLAGEMPAGIADLEASVTSLTHLSPGDLERVGEIEREGVVLNRPEARGLLAAILASVGRIDDALALAESIIEHVDATPLRAWWARAIGTALAGQPAEAAQAFRICHDTLISASDISSVANLLLFQLSYAQLPYGADDLGERRRSADEREAAWSRSSGAHGDVSPRIASLPILWIEGDWQKARELAENGRGSSDTTSEKHLVSTTVLAQLAHAQGDASLAWSLIHELLPGGPQTIPGNVDLMPALTLIRIAASLCLDVNDFAAAQTWLDTHDRWLAWSGAVLGKADGQILRAEFAHATGDSPIARDHAVRALELAGNPRQPLALLSAHRLLGEIDTSGGRLAEARSHLDAALALANACAAPYERALTMLVVVKLEQRAGAIDAATKALNEARAIFDSLGAVSDRIPDLPAAVSPTTPAGLSPRELDVLRLLSSGRSNREIAETLYLSIRTIERHLTNIYNKLDVHGRAEAIVFAHQHTLT